ncbi:uncharacterized protein [Cherax quadricarinatus]|uniref:uncharacterized protein n=1 Tax=Cherax quadricarinatus TaxID=27406 RepID=UPI00387E52E9
MTVGSSLRLVCVLRDNTQPPTYVFWYHDQHMINYHATREVRVENNGGLSVLFLSNVRPADSGNYSCAPSNARPAHIYIHVLKVTRQGCMNIRNRCRLPSRESPPTEFFDGC